MEPTDLLPDISGEFEEMEITPSMTFHIGKNLPSLEKDGLIYLYQANLGVFVWRPVNLQGIDPSIITHKFNVVPGSKLVRQKTRGTRALIKKSLYDLKSKNCWMQV